MNQVVDVRTATPDPPPTGIVNPIHDAEGADAAGYAGALVAGVRTYGWAAQTIVRALGDEWLASGWVDYSLRRPLFSGEELTTTLSPDPDGSWHIECVGRGRGGERTVLDGTAGLGQADWLADLTPPTPGPGTDPPALRPTYDLETIPEGEPLRPFRVYVKADAARRMATEDLGLDDPRYAGGRVIHPFFLAGRMAPLTRHNFTYGPTIHVRSQIQHRAEAVSDNDITVGATIVDAYDRNDHWYQVLDGVVTEGTITEGTISEGPGNPSTVRELAVIRHHTIFRPRGTTMPPPITA